MYSDLYLRKNKKIIVVTLAVFVSILLTVSSFIFKTMKKTTKASARKISYKQIVNLSPTQAGIFWSVQGNKDTGWIVYGKSSNNFNSSSFDERDLQNKNEKYLYHFTFLKELEPDTVYYYKVVSGGEVIVPEGKEYFSFKTPPNGSLNSSLRPIYGTVIYENGQPASDLFVTAEIKGVNTLFTTTKDKGEWLMPLQYLVSIKTNNLVLIGNEDEIIIHIISSDSNYKTDLTGKLNDFSPLTQTIVFGKNYDVKSDGVVSSLTESTKKESADVSLIFPVENSIIPGKSPLIKGTGLTGKEAKIIIDSDRATQKQILIENDGSWIANVGELSPGKHLLTYETVDNKNKQVIISRNFSIAKSGEQVLGTATPSATIAPSLIPSLIPTQIVVPTATVPPIIFTPTGTPPVTGINSIHLTLLSFALLVVGVGFLVVF